MVMPPTHPRQMPRRPLPRLHLILVDFRIQIQVFLILESKLSYYRYISGLSEAGDSVLIVLRCFVVPRTILNSLVIVGKSVLVV